MRTTRKGRDATRPAAPTTPAGRPGRRLRTRLLGAVLVTLIAVLAAGAPSVAIAARDLTRSQRLLRLSQLNTTAVALSHALADERDATTVFAAEGRPRPGGPTRDEEADVDRQTAEADQQAAGLDTGGSADLVAVTRDLRTALSGIPRIRRDALTGTGTPAQVFAAYTPVIDALDAVGGALARALPDRAADPDTNAGAALAHAVSEDSAQHGLLLAALHSAGGSAPLVGAARIARLREQAAEDDFTAAATPAARTEYDQTVTGADVTAADGFLRRFTATPDLTAADRGLDAATVDSALSARVDRMRAVQASLAAADSTRLTALRDQDVTALEIRGALVGLCALLSLGIGIQTARSVTRPLARVRHYAAEPAGPAPVASGDEFAAVAEAVERLAAERDTLRERAAAHDEERDRTRALRTAATAERDELRRREAALTQERAVLAQEKDALTARLGSLEASVGATFVNLSLRTLALVERQLALIEGLENGEQDPDELETLFRLDHLATRMRRNSESLLVLAGADAGGGAVAKPVPVVDVVRAGVSEIERYERVRIPFLPRAQLVGFAADDAGHLVAELLENATSFSPPEAEVRVSGWLLETGEVMLSVEDDGIGVPPARLDELNRLLADPRPDQPGSTDGLGLYVVARLAGRHGIRVELRPRAGGGTCAVVVVPHALVTGPPDSDWTRVAEPATPAAAAPATEAPTARPPMAEAPRSEAPAAHAPATEAPAAHAPGAEAPAAPPAEHTRADAGPAATGLPTRPRTTEPGAPEALGAPEAPESLGAPEALGAPGTPREQTPQTAVPQTAVPQADVPQADVPDSAAAPASAAEGSLPKRIPRSSGLSGEPASRGPGAPVDAAALRRKLGGFAAGLRDGRRDAEAEATGTAGTPLPAPRTPGDRSDSEPSEEARG